MFQPSSTIRAVDIRAREPVLSVCLSVDYPQHHGVLQDAEFEVRPGEIVGFVGESGSGKTTLAMSLLRLLDPSSATVRGRIEVDGIDILSWNERRMRTIRGSIVALVPQSPASALNPQLRLETHLKEAWNAHSRQPWDSQVPRVEALFRRAGLPFHRDFLRRFPGQISLGQGQRLLIVMALLHSPRLLIADEPTSSLDLVTQAEVLKLLRVIRNENDLGMLFISHDIPAVATVCDRIAVLYGGRVVESGSVRQVLSAPEHPYTRRLIDAAPKWR
jgi:ABC-type glutathione transport system ATPase component